jgi:hypothetical protein
MPSTLIFGPCVSSSLLSLSSSPQKQEIVQNDPANRSSSLLRWLPHFHGLLPMQSFIRGEAGYQLHIARWQTRSFSGGSREKECKFLACSLIVLPHFHGLLPMQSFSGGKPDIDCIRLDGKLDLSPGEAEKKSVD